MTRLRCLTKTGQIYMNIRYISYKVYIIYLGDMLIFAAILEGSLHTSHNKNSLGRFLFKSWGVTIVNLQLCFLDVGN